MLSSLHLNPTLNYATLNYSATLLPLRGSRRRTRRNGANESLVSTAHPARQYPSLSASLAPAREVEERKEEALLPPHLRPESLPRHVAVIMDGNSRWAKARGLPSSAGHEAGYRTLKKMVELSCQWGIRALTVFAFSSENWTRPKMEVDFLMTLFENVLKEGLGEFVREGIRICIIGDSSELPQSLQKLAKEVVDKTKNNTQIDLIVAISYSGRKEITQACQNIAQKVKDGLLEPEDITESHIEEELETNCIPEFPNPDLLIRTSGELRLSNFLLWQSAYTELFFTNTYWPDFGEADYIEALTSFQNRQRRFGQRIN
ncbi:unnamed protein product [Musa acuminata subsp. malaccensis]|uniref:Alkyl transferase n=1 Tax=Musa acuminata subsp. malaccensis TaxID=214687 RepID=A0A804J1G2_MUSAM|nr:PREDICTED: dehydrodolichyl diphosphate synthase 2-like [Musa acuminata subsp. malaccensis]CAG1837658.1 unnamed protein product [Musa acuminata subsp. malaccensis]